MRLLFEVGPLFAFFGYDLSMVTHGLLTYFLIVICRYDFDVTPFAHFFTTILVQPERCHTEPVRCAWHEVSDDAFVCFALVYLSELFLAGHFDAHTILQHILYAFAKVGCIAPCNLYAGGCLCNVYEHTFSQWLFGYESLLFFLVNLVGCFVRFLTHHFALVISCDGHIATISECLIESAHRCLSLTVLACDAAGGTKSLSVLFMLYDFGG